MSFECKEPALTSGAGISFQNSTGRGINKIEKNQIQIERQSYNIQLQQ